MHEVKIGETITIGGFDYDIVCNEESDKELQNDDRWGEHSDLLKRVRLPSKVSPQQFNETFIHEVLLHAVDLVYLGTSLNEKQVIGLSAGIHQVLEGLGVRFVK